MRVEDLVGVEPGAGQLEGVEGNPVERGRAGTPHPAGERHEPGVVDELMLDFDASEAVTGPWCYPPTAKLERLLRHVGIPVGFLFNADVQMYALFMSAPDPEGLMRQFTSAVVHR